MDKKQIFVLFGGCSTEYQISLQSAFAVLNQIDQTRYTVHTIGITQQGDWMYYNGAYEHLISDTWWAQSKNCTPCAANLSRTAPGMLLLDGSGQTVAIDAMFPVLHGKNAEDGTVQALAQLMGVPLVGCGVLASALCMDKHRAHQLAAAAGISVPRGVTVSRIPSVDQAEELVKFVGLPAFVKPVRSGSSFGISRIEQVGQLIPAVEAALEHDNQVIIEQAVDGFEVGCSVIGNEILTTGCVDEIELSEGFFNFEEKYTLKTSAIHCPARIDEQTSQWVQEAAKVVYKALDCRGFARVDFFLKPDGALVFNEVNTIPGFTSHSRFPNMMKAVGMDFPALVNRLIALGFAP